MEIRTQPGGRCFRIAFFVGAFFSLFSLLHPSFSFAKIQDWDFKKQEDYQFDSRKIKIEKGNVSLVNVLPFQDSGETFESGSYQAGTRVQPDGVGLLAPALIETESAGLPAPLQGAEAGRVALWHFDEPNGSNVLDEVGRNVAKTSDTEVVSGQTGFGYARLFDGSKSYIFVPHYQAFEWKGPFTLEAWIRPTNPKGLKPQTIISRWQTIGAQKGFALQITPEGKLDFVVSPDGSIAIHHPGQSILAPGVWYHVAAVFTGDDLRIYVNGAVDGAPTLFHGPVYQSANPVYLGALVDSRVDQFFAGAIDETAFYNYALSEVEALTHAGNSRGIVGLWHFNERTGLIMDSSGYGHTGIAYAGPVYESEGKLGTSIHFNGKDQFIETPPSSRLAPQKNLTLEAWIRPDALPGLDERMTVLSASGGEFALALAGPDGRLVASGAMLNPVDVTGRIPLAAGIWHHVAAVWSGGEVRIYADGVLDTASGYAGDFRVEKTGIRVAMDSKNMSAFRGLIDEAAVYRRARSASDIAASAGLFMPGGMYTSTVKDAGASPVWKSFKAVKALDYGAELSDKETGLLHLYHFNEKEVQEIHDNKADLALAMVGTYSVPGVFSNARWFSTPGTDKMISQREFPPLSTFSISLWFEFSGKEPGVSDRILSIGDEKLTLYRSLDGRMHVHMEGARDIHGDQILKDSQWHHLTVTADGRSLFLYIDGMLDGNSPMEGGLAAAPLVLGNLKSSDTFRGAIDEFAFYNYGLEREAVFQNFLKGKLHLKFLLRDSEDASFANVKWHGPGGERAFESEPGSSTAGVWRLNDSRFTGEAGEVKDSSPFAGHGTAYGSPEPALVAVFGGGVRLNGAGDHILIPDSQNLHPAEFTLSAWIKPEQIQNEASIVDKRFQKGGPVFSSFALELTGAGRLALRLGRPGGYNLVSTDRDGEVAAGRWSHVAATYNRKEVRLFINGELKKKAVFTEPVPYDEGPLYFGRYGSSASRYFRGELDEVRLESRALEPRDIQEMFAHADPENFFSGSGSEPLGLGKGRFFQYQALFSTSFPVASPGLEGVEIRANDFPSDRPVISNLRGISYADISHFREKLGPAHKGAVTYQLSNDGMNWYFHNGRRWVAAGGATDSNTASQVEDRIRDFAKELGAGSFYFKAFLHSPSGFEPVEFQGIQLEYLPNKLTLSSPNGAEAWRVGDEQEIRWDATGEVKSVTLEYSSDDFFKDFHIISENLPNQGTFLWKIPDEPAPSVKVRVRDNLDPRVYDASDIPFRIAGDFEVTSPNYAERWEVGTKQAIQWKTLGKIPEVKLDFSPDDFKEQVYPIVSAVKNTGAFIWDIPDHISSNVKVRVTDARDPLVYDQSNDVFALIGKFGISKPAAGDRWIVGSSQDIAWTTTGTVTTIRLEYRAQESTEWKLIANKELNRNHFTWTIPDDIHPEVRIRLSNADDFAALGTSGPFAVVGGLHLVHPRGGENWSVESRRKITWETIGTIPAVVLEYRKAEDKEWKQIASIPNSGNYVWEVPDALADSVFVRVTDARDKTVRTGESVSFSIVPGFILQSPNGSESWQVGTEQDIVWETKGTIEQVRIEYSTDGFAKDIHPVIEGASNIGRFSWTVPDIASPRVWIRVSDLNRKAAYDTSDAPFRIFADFRVKLPAGGEKFEVGTLATLEWQTLGSVPEVKLEYSRDDFSKDHRTIIESSPNQGRYTWTIPDDIGQNYLLRISDVRDPKTAHISEGRFSILGKFRLLEPAGGENLTAGTIVPVRWKAAGSVPVVTIDYSENDFKESFQTVAQAVPNTGVFQWTVPNLIGRKFKLRVWDPSHPDALDTMSEPARIIGGFRLISPNGGEVLYVGDKTELKWETAGNIPRVRIELSADGFNRDIVEIADSYENNGRYAWQIPDIPSGAYRVRISDPRDSTAWDLSNSDFRVRSHVTLIQPNGGEGWPVGQKQTLRWKTSASIPQVKLEYSTDDFQTTAPILEAAPNAGFYEWTVPDKASQNVKVRISDVKDPGGFDISDKPFRILGLLQMLSPNGGEIWKVGDEHSLEWKTVGNVPVVRIEYSRDGFSSEAKTIVESTSNSGTFNWRVPDDLSAQTKIRIIDTGDTSVQDVSDAFFQIAASFHVMAPNGGEVWHSSEKREINWMTTGTVREVILEVSKDDFKTEPLVIDRGVLNQGRFTWEVPEALGENFKIRVCDMDQPRICDISDNVFSIRSPLEIIYPVASETWAVGSDQEIRWKTYGRVNRVVVSYSTAKPHMEWKPIAEDLENQDHFLFRVPDQVSEDVFFRVADIENESLFSITKEPVQFLGNLRLIVPNGGPKGEVWRAESEQKIRWETLGTISNVRLEYSTDDFLSNVHLIESSIPNTGSYTWKIPQEPMKQVKVRVSDAAHPKTSDVSEGGFRTMTGFRILSPDSGKERLKSGEKSPVTWTTFGASPRIKLEYGIKDKDTYLWKLISDAVSNHGKFEWEVPGDLSGSDVKVRVTDVSDPGAQDETDSPFKILAQFSILSPQSGEILLVGVKQQIKWQTRGKVPFVKLEVFDALEHSSDPLRKVYEETLEERWGNTGSYYWTVPDVIREKLWIKVSDAQEPEAFRIMEQPFKIRGALALELPEGELTWPVGSLQTIRWKTTGTIPQVKLEYANDHLGTDPAKGTKTWKLIAGSISNAGSFGWTLPADNALKMLLRVSDATNPEVFSESSRFIAVPANFSFERPAGGERWTVGSLEPLRWKTSGAVKNIQLEYFSRGLTAGSNSRTWIPVTGTSGNKGSLDWQIPDAISGEVRLRIRDEADPKAVLESEPFSIRGILELIKPSEELLWPVGSRQELAWHTLGTIPDVRLEALIEGSPSPFVIAGALHNEERWSWTVPDKIANGIKLRVVDPRDEKTHSVSQKTVSIIAAFEFLSPKSLKGSSSGPAATERWTVGTDHQIAWKTQGTVASVLLEYSRDDFYRDIHVIASDVPNTGAALWTIPDAISGNVKIRISDFRDGRAFQVSDPIRIQGALSFSVPSSAQVWAVGSAQSLAWKTTGSIPGIRLEYSRDDFHRDIQVIQNELQNQGGVEWAVPDAISSTVKLRVSDASDASVFAVSEMFKIAGTLHLKSPGEGASLQVFSPATITWDTVGSISKVRLEFSRDDFARDVRVITTAAENKGEYPWSVPDTIGEGFKIRVLDAGNPSVSDVSSHSFGIHGALAFTAKPDGKRLIAQSEETILWETIGTIPFVRLEYSTSDFRDDAVEITVNERNRGRFVWKVPDIFSGNIKLRISDLRNKNVNAVTATPFTIAGKLELEPLASEVVQVGSAVLVRWKTTGTVPAVRLAYSVEVPENLQSPGLWKLITGAFENTGEYTWQVNDDISEKIRLQISDVRDEQVQAVSAEPFSIMPKFSFLTPGGEVISGESMAKDGAAADKPLSALTSGRERWIVGTSHQIQWETSGNVPEVKVEYSRDGFEKDHQVIFEKIPNTGRFEWIIPDAISDEAAIRVSDVRYFDSANQISKPFSIIGDFVFTSPSADQTVKVGEPLRIEWQTTGTLPKIKLEYQLPGDSSLKVIQDRVPNEGFYVWQTPDLIQNGLVLRISDARDSSVSVAAPGKIKILGAFEWISPSPAGESWIVGEERLLEWKTTGTIPQIQIDFSRDEFDQDIQPITPSLVNEGRMKWQVPDWIGEGKIRIRAMDGSFASNSAEVKIRGTLELAGPVGGGIFRVGESVPIEWKTTGTVPAVRVEYGVLAEDATLPAVWNMISGAVDNSGKLEWPLPDDIARKVLIRISDVRYPEVESISGKSFSIMPQLQFVSLSGGERWVVGSKQGIQWQAVGSVPVLRVEYSRDEFNKEAVLIADQATNGNRMEWVIPDVISDQIKIRISDVRYPEETRQIVGPVSITGALAMNKPGEAGLWKVGEKVTLAWQSTGTIPYVRLEMFHPGVKEGEPDFEVIADKLPNKGEYLWQVADRIGEGFRFRVSDVSDPGVNSLSSGEIKIQGVLEWKIPQGMESWVVGEKQVLEWKTTGTVPQIQIDFSRDEFDQDVQPITPGLANEGRMKWQVPDWIGEGKIRVRSKADASLQAVSGAIKIKGHLDLLKPEPGAILRVGSSTEIQWVSRGTIPLVRVEYSLDHFQNDIRLIDQALEASRLIVKEGGPVVYRWTVPDAISGNVKVRVSDIRDSGVSAVSAQPFRISGSFEFVSPRGGEIWTVGNIENIVWKTTGSIAKARLEFSRDGFKRDIQKIEEGLSNQGGFAWTIPDAITDRLWLRITDAGDEKASVILREPVSVQGALQMTAPIGGERWHVGDEIDFQWKTSGTIPQVHLEYFSLASSRHPERSEGSQSEILRQKAPQDDVKVIQEKIPNTGHFIWRVPDYLPPQTQFRVVNSVSDQVSSGTLVPVKILGTLRFIAPDAQARWVVGTEQKLAWETRGFVPKVKLEYSRDGFKQDVGTIEQMIENTGAGQWTVANLISKEFQLRVSDVENADVFALTQVPIEITGGLKVVSPAGGEVLEVNAPSEIIWQTSGNIPFVRLEYSRDGFAADTQVISEKLPNTGHLTWKVADAIGKNTKIRVVDAGNPEVTGVSEKAFSIAGRIFLASPQGGEIWRVADAAQIQWNTVGNISRIGLEYSIDDFAHSVQIAGDTPNQGRFIWRVPDHISENVKIRIFDAADHAVFAVTPTPIKIQGTLSFVVPHGGGAAVLPEGGAAVLAGSGATVDRAAVSGKSRELWRIGSAHTLLWQTTGSVPSVTLEYSTDNFATVVSIVRELANQGRFEWTVPDVTTDHLLLRVSNAADGSVFAVSEPLEIGGILELLTPGGGEVFRVGETQEIFWKTTGTLPRVRIEVSNDQFRSQPRVLEESLPNTGVYGWKIPDWIGEGYFARVSDASNPALSDSSKAPFKILGILNFDKPEGGEKWPVGSSQILTWNTIGTVPQVRLEYTRDDFVSSFPIEASLKNEGRFVWKVPDLTGAGLRFRISDVREPSITAETKYAVSVNGLLRLLTPAGGEKWVAQSRQSITWETTGTIPNVSIEYFSGDAAPVTIASTIANNGSFLWSLPDINTRDLRIRIFDSLHPEISAQTHEGLEVHGKLQLTSPAGGEIWFVGSEHPVTWNTAGEIPRVRLEYSTDHFRTVLPAVLKLQNQGKFIWRVPDTISREVLLRVTDDSNASVFSAVEKPFEIRGALSLVAPAGGEVWAVGTRHAISWQTSGSIAQVRLEYSIDDFVNHAEIITPALANKGVHYWQVPPIAASQAKVRVTDTANSEVYDISRNAFKVAGEIAMISPNNGETYRVGERLEIRWHASANIANVKLEYSTDDFETTRVAADFVPNTGQYVWNIPDVITDAMRVRVSDSTNASVYAFSRVPFHVTGVLRWISPRGGEVWPVGSRQTLKWETLGSIPKVRIEYSRDDFKTALPLTTGTANEGKFEWVVPELEHPEVRFRVSDASAPSVEAISEGKVRITGKLSLVSPSGGERWVAGEERSIRWETLGFITKVDLEYSKDDFNRDVHLIAASVPNVGSASWKIPNDLSTHVRVRVKSSGDGKVFSFSEAPFRIDLYNVRWIVKDRVSGEYLTGLRLSESSGKTQDALASSATLQYPYGIYSAVWTKPGYSEYRSTWLADKDQTFTVLMEPESGKLEMVRADFAYDRDKDLMNIKAWYEKDGRPVPAVIQCEVSVYDGQELVKTFTSTHPDAQGIFRMMWDTSIVTGDKRYLASAVITTASGKILTAPISYQIDLPVKEKKEPVLRPKIDSTYLKPLGTSSSAFKPLAASSRGEPGQALSPEKKQKPVAGSALDTFENMLDQELHNSPQKKEVVSVQPSVKPAEPEKVQAPVLSARSDASRLIVPEKGVLGETVSITYIGEAGALPVVDVYDANRRLAVRAQPMTVSDETGKYTYLLSLKGIAFIAGKPVTISVIDRASGRFKTAQIMVQSSVSALGWDEESGNTTLLKVLEHLDRLNQKVRLADNATIDMGEFLSSFKEELSSFAGLLTQETLKPAVAEKLNRLAEDLAHLARQKGYTADFLTARPIGEGAGPEEIREKLRRFQDILEMLGGLYRSSSGLRSA